jgi:hypothetical protein
LGFGFGVPGVGFGGNEDLGDELADLVAHAEKDPLHDPLSPLVSPGSHKLHLAPYRR